MTISAVNGSKIEVTREFLEVFEAVENTSRNIFITGKAGTGKSTLLQYITEHTRRNVTVLAPTGVAAVNVKGQTIHSFFRFRLDIAVELIDNLKIPHYQKKIYKNLDAIIIDEVSMVRADLLDCMDAFLRRYGPHEDKPFGGVQMIFFGDLYQLPPVLTNQEKGAFLRKYPSPYFFDAQSFKHLDLKVMQLDKIYRQDEEDFIHLLNAIRTKSADKNMLDQLNKRFQPDIDLDEDSLYIHLTTTNALAREVNLSMLKQLPVRSAVYAGEIMGEFDERILPTEMRLELKEGAQVMLLNNDPQGRWFNGTIGKISYLSEQGLDDPIEITLLGGQIVEVRPFSWEVYQYFYNEDTQAIERDPVGCFRQYPVKLAWAVTIHKSQGQTFDRVVIDLGNGAFSSGQTYVALSRCRRLDGLILKKPIHSRHILMDERVVNFMQQYNHGS